MKSITATLVAITVCSIQSLYGQASPAASPAATAGGPAKRGDVYSITFIHGAAGKATALGEWAKKSLSSAPAGEHQMLLRHEAGSPWDYVAVAHIGAKATVEPTGNPAGQALKPLMDWHDDTFVNGPSWAEFAKAMDLDESTGKPKTNESVYVISVYRPMTGQEDAVESFLNEAPTAGDLTAGHVFFQHLEGGAWRFCDITRYKNYADYGKSEAVAVAETAKGSSNWFKLRDLCSFHNDTVAAAIAP
ncbi:MAG: hypothetical protein M3032_12910 [Verrucomicrobiota bacterium]|nr:hypothetical protein [Verrucomicrobiota bacterium]